MLGAALLLTLTMLVAAPVASAAYAVGSQLTSDDPVELRGRVDALVRSGVAGYVSTTRATDLGLSLTAAEVHVAHSRYTVSCSTSVLTSASCTQPPQNAGDAPFTLTDATIQVQGTLTSYKAIVVNDPAYADTFTFGRGAILGTTSGATRLTTNDATTSISGYQPGWLDGENPGMAGAVAYNVPAWTPLVSSTDNTLTAEGNFETFLQGLRVRVIGTTPEGQPFEKTYDTEYPGATAQGTYSWLVLEARDAKLNSFSTAPLSIYGARDVDVHDGGSAAFTNAEGTVTTDDVEQEYAQQAVTLEGPVALKDITITEGSPARIATALSSDLFLTEELANSLEEESQAGQIAAAAAVGAGSASLLAAAAYFWPRLKYALSLLALPLYTRIERSQVLQHEKRDEIYTLIQTSPGIHAHEIGEKTQIGWGTTVYHLKMLEQHALVVSKKTGRYKRFYVNTGEYTKKKDVYAALRNVTAKSVAEYVVNNPGTTQKDLCAAVGIQPSLASWHVEKLEGVGLVKRVKDGRQVRYYAGEAWEQLNVRLTPGGGAEGIAET